jgi:hypothetical protein
VVELVVARDAVPQASEHHFGRVVLEQEEQTAGRIAEARNRSWGPVNSSTL